MTVTRTLHRAGNRRELFALAADESVDAIEADVWVIGGRMFAHHERPLHGLNVLVHNRGLRIPRGPAIEFDDLLEATAGRCVLVLDVRSWWNDSTPELAALVSDAPADARLALTFESWGAADRARAWLPVHSVAYSVRSERQLRRYIEARTQGRQDAVPLAARHTLLHDRADVEALRRFTPRIAAWTVDDVDRALDLASWGVDEIVSNEVAVLRAV
jgi:hypothetical protein